MDYSAAVITNEQATIKASEVTILHKKIPCHKCKGSAVRKVREVIEAASSQSSLPDMSIY